MRLGGDGGEGELGEGFGDAGDGFELADGDGDGGAGGGGRFVGVDLASEGDEVAGEGFGGGGGEAGCATSMHAPPSVNNLGENGRMGGERGGKVGGEREREWQEGEKKGTDDLQ